MGFKLDLRMMAEEEIAIKILFCIKMSGLSVGWQAVEAGCALSKSQTDRC